MKIMLDCSPAKLQEYRQRYAFDFWQITGRRPQQQPLQMAGEQ